MSATTPTLPPPELTSSEKLHALMNRIYALRADRDVIEMQIFDLTTQIRNLGDDRPFWHCRRCGYDWRGHFAHRAPRQCPRCHSCGWMEDPILHSARRPSDPPNPKWNKRRNRGGGSRGRLEVVERTTRKPEQRPIVPIAPAPVFTPPPQYEEVRTSLVPEPAVRFAEAVAPEPVVETQPASGTDGDTPRDPLTMQEPIQQATSTSSSPGAAADGAHQPENESAESKPSEEDHSNEG